MNKEKILNFMTRFVSSKQNVVELQQSVIELNSITTSLIIKILYNVDLCEKSAYLQYSIKPNNHISKIIEKVYNDAIGFNSITEFENFYSVKYLSNLIKHFYPDIKQGISRFDNTYYEDLNYIGTYVIREVENVMIKDLFSYSNDSMVYIHEINGHSRRWYDWDIRDLARPSHADHTHSNIMFLILLISSAFCICKILYINNKINKINADSEVYKIVKNMLENINDKDTIISKLKPLHDEFYREEFGNLSDDSLYIIAASILIEKVESEVNDLKKVSDDDKIIDTSILNDISKTIESRSKEIETINIIEEITNIICMKNDLCGLRDYIEIICTIPEFEEKYVCMYDLNKNERDKNRYLTGDFDLEKREEEERYKLDSIESGAQFEKYLCDLFRKLEYSVKHNGKAGDQGADLIINKNNVTYVVQAKFYSSKLDNTPVQEVVGAIKYYNADYGVVITNSSFTSGAVKLAKSNKVVLIDGDRLNEIIDSVYLRKNYKKDILKDYLKDM